MKLHPINHNHKGIAWCGLASLSIISGFGTQYCLDHIKQASNEVGFGPRRIKGIFNEEMIQALHNLAYKTECIANFKHNSPEAPNLCQFLFDNFHRRITAPDFLLLIQVPWHFLVSNGVTIIDTMRPNGCDMSEHPEWRKRIHRVFKVSELKCEDL